MAKSTILIPYRGIIELTGEHDTGKTIAMLQTVKDFSKTVFVDDDVKSDGLVKQMAENGTGFELYIDLAQERQKLSATPTADEILSEIVQPLVNQLTQKHHDVIIFDTWRLIYQAARGHVERNQNKYSQVVRWQGSSQIIQGLISKVARMIERDVLTRLKGACDLLLISHHVKTNYKGGVEIGVIPESSTTFDEVCNMRIWLKHNPQSGVPIMLFLKRPNLPRMTPKGLRPINIVPVKITPAEKEESIWDAINRYEQNPIGNRAPRADETPTREELSIIQGELTPEQLAYIKQMMEYNKQMEKELSESFAVEDHQGAISVTTTKTETPQEGPGSTETEFPDDYPVSAAQALARAKAMYGYGLQELEVITGLSFAQLSKQYQAEHWKVVLEYNAKEMAKKLAPAVAEKKAKKK